MLQQGKSHAHVSLMPHDVKRALHCTWKRKMTTLDSRKSEEAAVAIHEPFQMEAQVERGEEGRGEGEGERGFGVAM